MDSPTKRTLRWLRQMGYRAEVVEKWIPHTKVKRDLFGVIDIVAIQPDSIVGIQATSGVNFTKRHNKIIESDGARQWLEAGGELWLVAWRKLGTKQGKGGKWVPKVKEYKLEDFKNGNHGEAFGKSDRS